VKPLPPGHNWHTAYTSGKLCHKPRKRHESYICLDCGLELYYYNPCEMWCGYFGKRGWYGSYDDTPLPDCKEWALVTKMDEALK